jgi:hypothetical protein
LPSKSGLPDGIIFKQKSKFGYILEGLAVDDVGIFYGHLDFTAIWYIFLAMWEISWLFGIFSPVLVRCTKKNLATLSPNTLFTLNGTITY